MIRITVIDPHDIKAQFRALPKRLESVRHAMGSLIAEELRDEIKKKIPGTNGWLGIYSKAINFYFDGNQWAIAGEANVPIKVLDASVTYVSFSGDDPQSAILAEYNPWVLHLIPAINQPYRGRMRATTAAASAVQAAERRLMPLLPAIKQRLSTAGFSIVKDGIPVLGGTATADLRHMALQLEYGRPPFEDRPKPHWRPAVANVSNSIQNSYRTVRSKFEGILRGDVVSKGKLPSSNIRSLILGSKQQQVPKI